MKQNIFVSGHNIIIYIYFLDIFYDDYYYDGSGDNGSMN